MTPAAFEKQCAEICPLCKAGVPARLRTDTNEWVHDTHPDKKSFAHSLCLAHYFRLEHGPKIDG
jgi:hypothetical protein